ncbi:ABC transporter permease [Paenarthrobacter sp. A20]|uniref:ABC transporter permease n=1 Tax=Paenarthrobacter sp. A20 TaxID=2817891 RepID=UPI00209DB6B3|nr:ABC transporter permease [Paenarthrobacter sp. A20]MCP1412899.1 putative ABC transport system permease protein [Paenarthrobacter sp. A20]
MSIIVIAGMCVAVLLTTGRTAGVGQSVLESIDSAGTRSIAIRSDPDSGLNTAILERIKNVEGVEWAGAFSSAFDSRNARVIGGNPVPIRELYTFDPEYLGLEQTWAPAEGAFASSAAIAELGMSYPSGGLYSAGASRSYELVGDIQVPDFLQFLEPLVLVPRSIEGEHEGPNAISLLVVIAERAELVSPIAATLTSLLGITDISKVTLETSEQLASLQSKIHSQLKSYSHELVMGIFFVTVVLVMAVFSTHVMIKRREFGRRRALGATRRFITMLLICQAGIMSLVGAGTGAIVSAGVLHWERAPQPPPDFYLGIVVLAVLVGVIAVVLPAYLASHRDPVRELRVP